MPKPQVVPTSPRSGSLTLKLLQTRDQEILLRAVVLAGTNASLSISFGPGSPLDSTLCKTASRHVAALLRDVGYRPGARELENGTLKLKTLILTRASLASVAGRDGSRRITLTFERVFGQLMHLFSHSVDVADALNSQARALAETTIENIYAPLFDFADFLENAHDCEMFGDRARLYRHLNATHHRIRELERHYEKVVTLMRREGLHSDAPAAAPSGARLQ